MMYEITFIGFNPFKIWGETEEMAVKYAVENFKDWGWTVSKKGMIIKVIGE